jgi:cellulose synthase/poly-beta-1,6-N-acetylglucosamine synthase-like glycosyltransferase
MPPMPMKTTVLIPTYRRPDDLHRCLEALQQQQQRPDEVLVIVRDSDADTWAFLDRHSFTPLPVRAQVVAQPGQVAALNAGLTAATGDIIAITDDDAAPHPAWLALLTAHFEADPQVGGVGGRDWMYLSDRLQDATLHPGASEVVGRVQWFGKVVGNHHIGQGQPREVDVLKGANMSYRRQAIGDLRFDAQLQGKGAQVHNDLAFSLAIKQRGWKLIYDPAVAVDHFLAARFDRDQRALFDATACTQTSYNETLVLLRYFSWLRWPFYLAWAFLVGTRKTPGLVQLVRLLPTEREIAFQRWWATAKGRLGGFWARLTALRDLAH